MMSIRYINKLEVVLFVVILVVISGCAHKKTVLHIKFTPTPVPEVPTQELAPLPTMSPVEALKIAGEYFQEAKELRKKGDLKNAKEKYLTARRTLISGGIAPQVFKELRDEWENNFLPESEKNMNLEHLNTWKIISGLKSKGRYSEIIIPFPLPERVIFEIEDVLNRYPTRFQEGLNRSGLYIKYIRGKLAEQGLPEELCWLAMVESMFQTKVNSPAGAGGMWQFIRSTGKNYGLVMDSYLDERYNWVLSTRAAIDYLKSLHDFFGGDWCLAISAYNMGENGLKRIIEACGNERNFWRLIETQPASEAIKDETKKYYPRFLAYIFICNDPTAYGFSPSPFSPIEWDEVYTDGVYSLAMLEKSMGYESGKLSQWNPFLIRGVTPPYPYRLMVPKGDGEKLAQLILSPTFRNYQYAYHTVKRGETAYSIAHRYGITIEELLEVNSLSSTKSIQPGMSILVPAERRGKISFAKRNEEFSKENVKDSNPTQIPDYHEVKPGETLYIIAKKYNTDPETLAILNELKPSDVIRPGEKLRVRIPNKGISKDSSTISGTSYSEFEDYIVKRGDNLAKIAKNYSVTVSAIKEANNLTSEIIKEGDTLKIPLVESTAGLLKNSVDVNGNGVKFKEGKSSQVRFHVVEKGDTLSKISMLYSVPLKDLMRINGLTENSVLSIGQKIYLCELSESSAFPKHNNKGEVSDNRKVELDVEPNSSIVHIVQAGENLWSLAKKYNTEVSIIERANKGINPSNLKVGSKIVIPIKGNSDGQKKTKLPDPNSNLSQTSEIQRDQIVRGDNRKSESNTKVYVIQKGDTLIGISKKTGVPVKKILELNSWDKDRVLKIGDVVKLE